MVRMRRLRSGSSLRDLVRETAVTTNDLVYPVFIKEGKNIKEPVPSMPGIYQYSHDRFDEELERVISAGIKAILVFGIPKHKNELGSEAYNDNGVTQNIIREIKKKAPDIVVIADVCLCEYTSHGHCGIICGSEILNDETLEPLANEGADCAASLNGE